MARAGRPNKTDPRFDDVDWLIRQHDNEGVKKILSETGIEATDSYLRTTLILAALHKNVDLLRWLIENGANVNHQDRNGYSALHFAAQEKTQEAAKLLLDNGASLELADIHGNTPIWTAIFSAKGELELVKLYVQRGANLDVLNKYQNTPRQLAETFYGNTIDSLL
jgi:ankyrin repeat protein